jgi:HAD superfamily hydrolase (TIGR01484 family)
MIHWIVGGLGTAPPPEGKPSVLPHAIFGLIKPGYLLNGDDQSGMIRNDNAAQRLQPLTAEALKSVRLLASDMDGTLTQQERFTPRLLQALQELSAHQIPVVIVTGRSAGWVSAVVHYLPVAGAIAENGGLFYSGPNTPAITLTKIPDLAQHRQQLAQMFAILQQDLPHLQPSLDNAFRLTDWTFDVQNLNLEEIHHLANRCQAQNWGFTYSTVQCHIKPIQQDKAQGLAQVMQRYFPDLDLAQVATVGDSPNDQPLFTAQFPVSVGVANLHHYAHQMEHLPAYITESAEVEGFCQIAAHLIGAAAR